MLFRTSTIEGYHIRATDGDVGKVDDFLFDEMDWSVGWLVVDTGGWLSPRAVLLPPPELGHPDRASRTFSVRCTRKHVEESPPIAMHLPVSRQMEARLYAHYGWQPYWMGISPLGDFAMPATPPELLAPAAEAAGNKPLADAHLRSTRDTAGYVIAAVDGDIGSCSDFVVDDEGWRIRYMLVDTGGWLSGREVLVSPRWIRDISWGERRIRVDLKREEIERSPEFDPRLDIDRSYEERLHGHYERTGYWE
jgi:uncharacterized protein YrrD